MSSGNPYPILLVHGIARFDILRRLYVEKFGAQNPADDSLHYFKGIQSHLQASGFETHHANLSFAADINTRAAELNAQVNALLAGRPQSKVHLIAHSMGGLDARHMLVDIPGAADKVASLTTLGTPHLGTVAADVGLIFGGEKLIDHARPWIDLAGYRDLTTAACAAFNERARQSEATNPVCYQACSSTQDLMSTLFVMHASWLWIKAREGDNDGLVSAQSQAWAGELRAANGAVKKIIQRPFPLPADHINQVGWWLPGNWTPRAGLFNVTAQMKNYEDRVKNFYVEIARSLPSN